MAYEINFDYNNDSTKPENIENHRLWDVDHDTVDRWIDGSQYTDNKTIDHIEDKDG